MISLSDISIFGGEIQNSQMIKPWWDVCANYLRLALVLLAVFCGALKVAFDQTICMPVLDCSKSDPYSVSFPQPQCNSSSRNVFITTLQNNKQYDYVGSVCGQKADGNFMAYLPLILFFLSMSLVTVGNIWLKLPATALPVGRFLALVTECYDAPGTIDSIVESWRIMSMENLGRETSEVSTESTYRRRITHDRSSNEETPHASRTDRSMPNVETLAEATLSNRGSLDQVTLAEKVASFRQKTEKPWKRDFGVVQVVYFGHWIVLVLISGIGLGVIGFYHYGLSTKITCSLDMLGVPFNVDFQYFVCSNRLLSLFGFILYFYEGFLFLHAGFCVWASVWAGVKLFKSKTYKWRMPKEEDVAKEGEVSKVDDVCKVGDVSEEDLIAHCDLGLFLHLLHICSQFHIDRFAAFLFYKRPRILRQIQAEINWPVSKLKKRLKDGGTSLSMHNINVIPRTVFDINHLQKLEFKNCSLRKNCLQYVGYGDEMFHRSWLTSLIMTQCELNEIPKQIFKIGTLSVLDLSYNAIAEVPLEIDDLKHLETLNLNNNKLTNLDGRIKLENLITLCIQGNVRMNKHETIKVLQSMEKLEFLEIEAHYVPQSLQSKRQYDELHHVGKGGRKWHGPAQSEMYDMNPFPCTGIIFQLFPKRHGDKLALIKDSEYISRCFIRTGFETRLQINETSGIVETMEKWLLETDLNNFTCFVWLITRNEKYDTDEVNVIIDAVKNCANLEGKPKLFFVHSITNETSERRCPPQESDLGKDMLIVYSTAEGASQTPLLEPSWFPTAFSEVFFRYACEEDVLNLLQLVTFKLSRKYKTINDFRKLRAPIHTLTKKLFLISPRPHNDPPGSDHGPSGSHQDTSGSGSHNDSPRSPLLSD